MSNSNHILILTPGFPKDEDDFNCIPPLQEYLIKFKPAHPVAEFSVISFQYPYQKEKYKWNGINIYPLGGKNGKLNKLFTWLKAIRTAKKIQNVTNIDAIHSL
jgi:hypothetical protein